MTDEELSHLHKKMKQNNVINVEVVLDARCSLDAHSTWVAAVRPTDQFRPFGMSMHVLARAPTAISTNVRRKRRSQ